MGRASTESNHRSGKKYRRKLKMEALIHYCGGTPYCQCPACNVVIVEFLSIDHIEGGGVQHRKKTAIGWQFYLWLKRNGYPEGFRVLCHNCNLGTHLNGGRCPHLRE